MSQFVRITGAGAKETSFFGLAPTGWFSMFCNELGGQIGHSLLAAQTAAICIRQRFQPCQNTLFALFLAYFCGLKRVFDPIYESVT